MNQTISKRLKLNSTFDRCSEILHKEIKLTQEKVMDKLMDIERVFLYSKNQIENRGIVYLAWIGGERFEVWYTTANITIDKSFIQEGTMEESIELFNKWAEGKRDSY